MALGPHSIDVISASWRDLPFADLYLDCRVVPHPPMEMDPETAAAWMADHGWWWVRRFGNLVVSSFETLPQRRPDGIGVYTVCCACAEGTYRSPTMARLLRQDLRERCGLEVR